MREFKHVFSQEIVNKFHNKMIIEDPGEWISATEQDSQNFDGYKCSGFNEIYRDIQTIYIQPLDNSMDDEFLDH